MEGLTTELGILTCLSVFAAMMWLPYIIGVNKYAIEGQPEDANFVRPPDLSLYPAWVHRAHRAHLNLIEQLVPFAVVVLIMDRVDGYSTLTYWVAIAFFWLRVAHAVGMISGVARMPLRPLIFSAGWVCCLLMAYAVFVA